MKTLTLAELFRLCTLENLERCIKEPNSINISESKVKVLKSDNYENNVGNFKPRFIDKSGIKWIIPDLYGCLIAEKDVEFFIKLLCVEKKEDTGEFKEGKPVKKNIPNPRGALVTNKERSQSKEYNEEYEQAVRNFVYVNRLKISSKLSEGFDLADENFDVCGYIKKYNANPANKNKIISPLQTYFNNLSLYNEIEELEEQIRSKRKEIRNNKIIYAITLKDKYIITDNAFGRSAYKMLKSVEEKVIKLAEKIDVGEIKIEPLMSEFNIICKDLRLFELLIDYIERKENTRTLTDNEKYNYFCKGSSPRLTPEERERIMFYTLGSDYPVPKHISQNMLKRFLKLLNNNINDDCFIQSLILLHEEIKIQEIDFCKSYNEKDKRALLYVLLNRDIQLFFFLLSYIEAN